MMRCTLFGIHFLACWIEHLWDWGVLSAAVTG